MCAIIGKSQARPQNADIAQSVEHLIGNEEVISSNLIISSIRIRSIGTDSNRDHFADIAQSVEHLIGNEEVISSNLIISSRKPRLCVAFLVLLS